MQPLILAFLLAVTARAPEVLRPWADAIAAQCDAGGATREECVRFAAQATVESRFAPYVLEGRCNDPAWRARQRGWWRKACDGGLAVGPWQLHVGELGIAAEDALDPVRGTAVAWAYWKRAPGAWTTWRAAASTAAWWLARPVVAK